MHVTCAVLLLNVDMSRAARDIGHSAHLKLRHGVKQRNTYIYRPIIQTLAVKPIVCEGLH